MRITKERFKELEDRLEYAIGSLASLRNKLLLKELNDEMVMYDLSISKNDIEYIIYGDGFEVSFFSLSDVLTRFKGFKEATLFNDFDWEHEFIDNDKEIKTNKKTKKSNKIKKSK